jgi:hypothetical protein
MSATSRFLTSAPAIWWRSIAERRSVKCPAQRSTVRMVPSASVLLGSDAAQAQIRPQTSRNPPPACCIYARVSVMTRSDWSTADELGWREAAWRWFLARGGEANLAEDLTHEALLRLLRGQQRGQPLTRAYLHRVCQSVLYDHLRQCAREPNCPSLDACCCVAVAESGFQQAEDRVFAESGNLLSRVGVQSVAAGCGDRGDAIVRLHGCRASLSGDTAFERFSCGGAGQHLGATVGVSGEGSRFDRLLRGGQLARGGNHSSGSGGLMSPKRQHKRLMSWRSMNDEASVDER